MMTLSKFSSFTPMTKHSFSTPQHMHNTLEKQESINNENLNESSVEEGNEDLKSKVTIN